MDREGARDLPHACTLRITPDGSGGVLLLRFDERGRGITDTWHETAAAAMAQARAEYDVLSSDWIVETS
jgi:hypothetical protein